MCAYLIGDGEDVWEKFGEVVEDVKKYGIRNVVGRPEVYGMDSEEIKHVLCSLGYASTSWTSMPELDAK